MNRRIACYIAAASCLAAAALPARAQGVVAGTVNLVAADNGGTVIRATSQSDNDKWAVRNLIDGNHAQIVANQVQLDSTESFGWRSENTEYPQEIVFAFKDERPRLIGRIVVDPVTADPEWLARWAKNFEVWVSSTTPDGTYELVDSYELAGRYLPHGQSFELSRPVEARYVKLRVTSNQGSDKYVELGEFEVYEALVGANELEKLIIAGQAWLTRLQGFRDGRAFVTSNPGPEAQLQPRNVGAAAAGATLVSATSEMPEPKWAKEHLIDGLHVRFVDNVAEVPPDSWGWSSADASFPQDIVIELAAESTVLIDSIVLDPATADSYIVGRAAKDLDVFASTTGPMGPWKHVGSFALMNRPNPQAFQFSATEAKWVKVRILSNHGSDKYVELGEIEIYEAIMPQEPLTQIVSQAENLVRELKQYRDKLRSDEGSR